MNFSPHRCQKPTRKANVVLQTTKRDINLSRGSISRYYTAAEETLPKKIGTLSEPTVIPFFEFMLTLTPQLIILNFNKENN